MFYITQKILLAGAIALGAAGANAATVTAIYTGTVGQGYDVLNVFGFGEGSSLDGKAFSMTFVYDTEIGRQPTTLTSEEVFGGYQYTEVAGYEISPITYAEFRINGFSVSVDIAAYGRITTFNDGTQSLIHHFAGSVGQEEGYVYLTESSATGAINPDLNAAQDIDGSGILSPITHVDANPSASNLNFDQGSFRHNGGDAYGSLKVDHLSITVSAVPLPSALPMFMVALLGLGMLRRRAG